MRNILIIAAVLVGAGTWMAQTADQMTASTPARATSGSAVASAARPQQPPPSGGRSLIIPRDPRGHFQTEGRIDGQRISFMVDTGASVIALNEKSAGRFGLRPPRGTSKASLARATGPIRAGRTRLAMVELGGRVVRDV